MSMIFTKSKSVCSLPCHPTVFLCMYNNAKIKWFHWQLEQSKKRRNSQMPSLKTSSKCLFYLTIKKMWVIWDGKISLITITINQLSSVCIWTGCCTSGHLASVAWYSRPPAAFTQHRQAGPSRHTADLNKHTRVIKTSRVWHGRPHAHAALPLALCFPPQMELFSWVSRLTRCDEWPSVFDTRRYRCSVFNWFVSQMVPLF